MGVTSAVAKTVVKTAGTSAQAGRISQRVAKRAGLSTNPAKAKRVLVASMMGTMLIVFVSEVRRNGPGAALDPSLFIAIMGVYMVLGLIAEASANFAKSLSVLIFVTVALTRGPESFEAIGSVKRDRAAKFGDRDADAIKRDKSASLRRGERSKVGTRQQQRR